MWIAETMHGGEAGTALFVEHWMLGCISGVAHAEELHTCVRCLRGLYIYLEVQSLPHKHLLNRLLSP